MVEYINIVMPGNTHQPKHKKNTSSNKELHYRDASEGEEYGTINCDKGGARFEVTLQANNQVVMAKARGSIIRGPKKQRLEKGDLVLLQRDPTTTTTDKFYILIKYSQSDVKRLQKAGELTTIKDYDQDENVSIVFENDVITNKLEEIPIDEDFIANI